MTVVCVRCGAALPANAANKLCSTCAIRAVLETVTRVPAVGIPSPAAPMDGLPTIEELQMLLPSLEVLELLGRGGMGAVFKAKQIALDRHVALKILPPTPGHEAAFAERFTREARSLARLNHPNIVGIHDFGEAGGIYYFVMEYVDGVNLREAMRAGGVTPDAALQIVSQVCDALQFAHDRGVVHRDIKPENLLLSNHGRVKIADFGLAKILAGDDGIEAARDRSLTATHQVMGTFHYMAHEQLEGAKHVDHRADIYSLGVTLYEMLTGELPFGRFALPSKKATVDARWDDVVLRSLEKSPNDRYQRASDFRGDVERLSRMLPPHDSPIAIAAALQTRSASVVESIQRSIDIPPLQRSSHWWLDRPEWARRIFKIILDIAVVALLICFVSYHGSHGNAGHMIEIGFGDPWLRIITGPAGSHFGINVVSWSAAAGLAGGLLIWLVMALRRIERRSSGLDSNWLDEGDAAIPKRSPWTRYFYWAGLPTLICWAIGPVGLFFVLASVQQAGARPTWTPVFIFVILLGIVVPVFFHYLWFLFGIVGPDTPEGHARRAGHWMFSLGVAFAVYGGAVMAVSIVAMMVVDNAASGISAMLGLAGGVFVFAGMGIVAMRGGHVLARRLDRIETRIAAVLFLLPATPLWFVSLPVGILVFRTLGRADVQAILEVRSPDASQRSM